MIAETYKGRKVRVKKGREWGTVDATVNGEYAAVACCYGDQAKAVAQIKTMIDHIDSEPVNGNAWDAKWYAPGTYELCPTGHPVAIGGQCEHVTCQRDARQAAHELALAGRCSHGGHGWDGETCSDIPLDVA